MTLHGVEGAACPASQGNMALLADAVRTADRIVSY